MQKRKQTVGKRKNQQNSRKQKKKVIPPLFVACSKQTRRCLFLVFDQAEVLLAEISEGLRTSSLDIWDSDVSASAFFSSSYSYCSASFSSSYWILEYVT